MGYCVPPGTKAWSQEAGMWGESQLFFTPYPGVGSCRTRLECQEDPELKGFT